MLTLRKNNLRISRRSFFTGAEIMKILFVAMTDSIHTARWISQIADQGWDLHLFPSMECGLTSPAFSNLTVHHAIRGKGEGIDRSVKTRGVPLFSDFVSKGVGEVTKRFWPGLHAERLTRLVNRLRPDLVHSLEIQHAGYLTLEAKKKLGRQFPPWIVTNWGSDISLFGRLPEHEPLIRDVLGNSDYYSCECRRDVCLAEAFGFRGAVLPVVPCTGGLDLKDAQSLRTPGPVHARRGIMLKGYQGWSGRALVGLRALERCADALKGYEVFVYSASPEVVMAGQLFKSKTGIPLTVVPPGTPHREMLRLHGCARISIGLSISDGISTSFLEALTMGSFPIQSWTACAEEWAEDGKSVLLVPPEDADVVELAIRRALTDDNLVERAAQFNWETATQKLDMNMLSGMAVDMYRTIALEKGIA